MKILTSKEAFSIIDNFNKVAVTVIGDVMLDRYIFGKVRRISPEAPVPVVEVTAEKTNPGGAANVCANISSLNGRVNLVSILGEDNVANQLIEVISLMKNVNCQYLVFDKNQLTTQKTRVIAEHQQVVRFDHEKKIEYSSKLKLKIKENIVKATNDSHAFILSDYGKGVLSKDIIEFAISLCRKKRIPVFVDPKIEHFMSYKGVTSMTPNVQEAFGGMRRLEARDDKSIEFIGKEIIKKLSLKTLIITRSERGMSVFDNSDGNLKITHLPTVAKEVFDVTGAGDTVISVATLSYVITRDILKSAFISNHAASIVVSKIGAVSITQEELKGAFI